MTYRQRLSTLWKTWARNVLASEPVWGRVEYIWNTTGLMLLSPITAIGPRPTANVLDMLEDYGPEKVSEA